jgi:hypothetical protein
MDDIVYEIGEVVTYYSDYNRYEEFRCIVVGKETFNEFGFQYKYHLKPIDGDVFENCKDGINKCVNQFIKKIIEPRKYITKHTI